MKHVDVREWKPVITWGHYSSIDSNLSVWVTYIFYVNHTHTAVNVITEQMYNLSHHRESERGVQEGIGLL